MPTGCVFVCAGSVVRLFEGIAQLPLCVFALQILRSDLGFELALVRMKLRN